MWESRVVRYIVVRTSATLMKKYKHFNFIRCVQFDLNESASAVVS